MSAFAGGGGNEPRSEERGRKRAVGAEEVTIYSDGACHGNPGPGGFAAIIVRGDGREEVVTGAEPHTTNNRMELMAAIRGLEALGDGSRARLVTDSQYVKNGITTWIHQWLQRGWKTSSRKDVLNRDLWERLHALCRRRDVSWEWVQGHSGHSYNERCDRLATAAIERLRQSRHGDGSRGREPGP